MAESQVQLKREEIVGDEVILTDINPHTTTESVTDLENGLQLNDTLNRLWSKVNDRLKRYVHSVNGRTGIIVLTADDVGLGNVDNISYADIQNWVIDQIKDEFGSRAFKLYNNMDEAKAAEDTNDKSLSGAGFYASAGLTAEDDSLGYIGVFMWDDDNEVLNMISKPVNIIGSTDNSVLYNEVSNGRDYSGGKLGINIWKDEDGLEIYNGTSADPINDPKENAGLRLVRENIIPKLETMAGCYGSDFEHPGSAEDSWLYADTHPNDAPTVKIIYDGKDLSTNSVFYAKRTFKLKDQFICCFSAKYGFDYETQTEMLNLPAGVDKVLVDQHTALGIVTEINKDEHDNITSYTVEFTPMTPRVGDGISYVNYDTKYSIRHIEDLVETMHNNQLGINCAMGAVTIGQVHDDVLDPSTTHITDDYFVIDRDNVSGFTIRRNRDQRNPSSGESYCPGATGYIFTNLPAGPFPASDPRYRKSYQEMDGIAITPDASLCIIPLNSYWKINDPYLFQKDTDNPDSVRSRQYNSFVDPEEPGQIDRLLYGSDAAMNWKADADFYTNDDSITTHGMSMIGINLNKAMMHMQHASVSSTSLPALANISGLRIYQYSKTIDGRIFGGETANDIPEKYQLSEMTGGLAINCGKYLHIEPTGYYCEADDFYDGGKLTIDTGFGFEDDEDGKMMISIDAGKGLQKYTDAQGTERLGIKIHRGGMAFESGGLAEGALTLANSYVKHGNAISLKAIHLTDSEKARMDATGNEYETDTLGGPNAFTFALNAFDGLLINTDNELCVKTVTYKIEYDETGQPKRGSDGHFIRTVHGHGLQLYGDDGRFTMSPDFDPQDWDPLKVGYNNDAIGIQVSDPDTGSTHGLYINDKGTLCVEEATAEIVKKWKIEGTEVVTINGVEADREKKTYEYIPNKDALTIKLGKGLIFIDERSTAYDPDEEGCPCGCDCINYDNGSGTKGATFEIYDYIKSDGHQKIESIATTFNINTTHIIAMSFMVDYDTIKNGSVIFEVGKHGASGTQGILYEKTPNPTAVVMLYEGGGTGTRLAQPSADGTLMKDKKYDLIAAFNPTLLHVDWADSTIASQLVEAESSSSVDSVTLSDMLISVCGPSGVSNEDLNSAIRIYGIQMFEDDGDTMIADLVPCKSSAGYFGLFDRVNNRFYRDNSADIEHDFTGGTPTGEVINGKGESVTPADPTTLVTYDELTYIATDGRQKAIVDIEFTSPSSPHFITPSIKTTSTTNQTIFEIGEHEAIGTQYCCMKAGVKTFGIYDTTAVEIAQTSGDATVANNNIFDGYAQFETGKMFIKWIEDNTEQHLANDHDNKADFNVSSGELKRTPITLFGTTGASSDGNSSIYFYGLKIAENNRDNIIANLVPVISSDNVVGLFDKTNKKFITKTDGSSDFIAGSRTGDRLDYEGNPI